MTGLDGHEMKCTNEVTLQPDPQGVFTRRYYYQIMSEQIREQTAKIRSTVCTKESRMGGGGTTRILKMPNPIKDTVSGKSNKKIEIRQDFDIQKQLAFSIATLTKLEKKIAE
ncbi:hypothetical protein DPMN_009020 [Dreissena polymorpha]|uniref:Uncharacterized protein n=1 Tax=Dreissena polymorpha TaxID=45954 RepID=A0A9D4MWA7_DREPO|nr:hypothetical protein DPMN_009020 [Dreissena polymorpha]